MTLQWNFCFWKCLTATVKLQCALHSSHIFVPQVVERKRTPAEIREEYERLQKEREERRLQQRTNPKVCNRGKKKLVEDSEIRAYWEIWHLCLNVSFQGTISVGIDATDLFDRYEEDFEDMGGGGFPHVEINKMHISQSIEVIALYSAGVWMLVSPNNYFSNYPVGNSFPLKFMCHSFSLLHRRLLWPQKTRPFCLVLCQHTMEMEAALLT